MIKKNISNISKKSRTIAATAFVLGAVAVSGMAGIASADTGGNASSTYSNTFNSPMNDFISAIASRFNLSPSDVQSVVDSVMGNRHHGPKSRGQMQMSMTPNQQFSLSSRLAQAVTDGKITQSQSDLIVTKSEEIKATIEANRASDQNLSFADRKAKMDAIRADVEQWATANNIPQEYARFVIGGGMWAGHRGMHRRVDVGTSTPGVQSN